MENSPQATSCDQLRIAFCLPELQWLQHVASAEMPEAAHIQQGYIAAGLQARGHKLTFSAPRNLDQVVCTNDLERFTVVPRTWSDSCWFELASKAGWRVQQWLGVPYLNVFSNYRRFDACLRCLPGHDLVYERNGLFNAGVAMACKRLRLPYVLFFDADQLLELDFMGQPITGLLRWRASSLLRYNLEAADCIICVSEPAKLHLMTVWGVPAEKIGVFPNGVDLQRFRPYPESSDGIRASLGVGTNPLVIFVGSFYHWHDVATLLDAFSQMLGVHPDARLVLVGDGSQRQMMMQRAADLGLGDAVQFTGLVAHAEVPPLMAAADVAVAPYPCMRQDLWLSPMKLFEYMASGVAVVASEVGQLSEVVQDGRNGLLVPPGDVSALAAALASLIDDLGLRSRLAQQARQDAVLKHSWENYISRLERLFAAVRASQPVNLI